MKLIQRIPAKYARFWGWIGLAYTLVIFVFLLLSRLMLRSKLDLPYIGALLVLALISALVTCAGGFLGGRLFFIGSTAGLLAGLGYMMYIVVFSLSPGWGDLTSIVGYMFLGCMGVIIGLIAEGARWLLARLNRKA